MYCMCIVWDEIIITINVQRRVSGEESDDSDDGNYVPYVPLKQRKKMQVDLSLPNSYYTIGFK